MKAALLYGLNDLRVVEVDKPIIKSDEILVEIHKCGVCPTDIRKYRAGSNRIKYYPFNLGHEWSGVVVEKGKDTAGFDVGDRVVGMDFRGYAEYAVISQKKLDKKLVVKIPEDLSYEKATLFEPLADCLHSIQDKAKVKPGDWVAVLGGGSMGLLHLMVLKNMGCHSILIEILPERLNIARSLGADVLINPQTEDPISHIRELTNGNGVDSAIVSIGIPVLISQGLEIVKEGGSVILFGGTADTTGVEIDINTIHYREINLVGSAGLGRPSSQRNVGLLDKAIELLTQDNLPAEQLITHRFSLDDIEEAFRIIEEKKGIKAMISIKGEEVPHKIGFTLKNHLQ